MKKVLVIKGTSQYDQFRFVCDEMFTAFTNLGCLVTLLDCKYFDFTSVNKELFADYDLIFSFNGIGIELYNAMLKKPMFWTFLVDHPFHHNSRLKQINDNVMVSCIDRRHVEYIDRYYKNIPWTCFMPHGGITGEAFHRIPYTERKYGVILMGSLGNIDEINSRIKMIESELEEIAVPVIEGALKDLSSDLEHLVYDRMSEIGIPCDDATFTDIMEFLNPIDTLRRYHKRSMLVDSLAEQGIPIDIWGNGWDGFKSDKYSGLINVHDNVSYNEAKLIMRDARIILSDLPLFHDGSHERVFAAMQSGAISVSDRSIYLEECFTDGENIIFYEAGEVEELASRIRDILSDPSGAQKIINSADMLADDHTWQSRAAAILEIVDSLP